MLKRMTILTEKNLESVHIQKIRHIVAGPMLSNGTIATCEIIDNNTIEVTGLFMRGVNQAYLAIASYLTHNGIYFIVE